jgi:hypothetical protein
MSRLKTYPITHYEFDDLVNALDTGREGIVKICGDLTTDAIGWWRFKERIPVVHLESLGNALEKKLKSRKDLNPVELRAITFVRLALAGGSAVPLSPQSPFAASFGVDSGASKAKAMVARPDLTTVPLEELIAEIKRRGGSVNFGNDQSTKRRRNKK